MKKCLNTFIIIIALCSLLGGCRIGPKLRLPEHHFSDHFKYQHTISNDSESLVNWWHQFKDSILDTLINEALITNYDLARALVTIEQSRAAYRLSRAQLWPEIDGVLQVNQNKYSTVLAQTSFLDADPLEPYLQLGFQGSWEIDLWGKLTNDVHAAHFSIQAQKEAYFTIRLMVITNLVRWYVDWCTAGCKLQIIQQQLYVAERQLLLTNALYMAGLTSEKDVQVKKERIASIKAYNARLHSLQIQAHAQLALLVGKAPDQFNIVCSNKVPVFNASLSTGIPSDLIRRRPDIRQKEYELCATNQRVARAIKEWFPSFSLLGGLSAESSEGSSWFTAGAITWSIGPSFNWPILNFGRITARIDERKAQMKNAALAYSQAIIVALSDVEQALGGYLQLCRIENAMKEKYDAGARRTILSQDMLESGLTNELSVLAIYDEQLAIEHEYVDAQQGLSNGIVALYGALAGGW